MPKHSFDQVVNRFRLPFADRPIDVAGLAESAAARAATGNFHGDPVMDCLQEGDDRLFREGGGVQVGQNPSFDLRALPLLRSDRGDFSIGFVADGKV